MTSIIAGVAGTNCKFSGPLAGIHTPPVSYFFRRRPNKSRISATQKKNRWIFLDFSRLVHETRAMQCINATGRWTNGHFRFPMSFFYCIFIRRGGGTSYIGKYFIVLAPMSLYYLPPAHRFRTTAFPSGRESCQSVIWARVTGRTPVVTNNIRAQQKTIGFYFREKKKLTIGNPPRVFYTNTPGFTNVESFSRTVHGTR